MSEQTLKRCKNAYVYSNQNIKRLVEILLDVGQNFKKQLGIFNENQADLIKNMPEQSAKLLST
jgi:hypothetical protein